MDKIWSCLVVIVPSPFMVWAPSSYGRAAILWFRQKFVPDPLVPPCDLKRPFGPNTVNTHCKRPFGPNTVYTYVRLAGCPRPLVRNSLFNLVWCRNKRQRGVDFAPQLPQHCFLFYVCSSVSADNRSWLELGAGNMKRTRFIRQKKCRKNCYRLGKWPKVPLYVEGVGKSMLTKYFSIWNDWKAGGRGATRTDGDRPHPIKLVHTRMFSRFNLISAVSPCKDRRKKPGNPMELPLNGQIDVHKREHGDCMLWFCDLPFACIFFCHFLLWNRHIVLFIVFVFLPRGSPLTFEFDFFLLTFQQHYTSKASPFCQFELVFNISEQLVFSAKKCKKTKKKKCVDVDSLRKGIFWPISMEKLVHVVPGKNKSFSWPPDLDKTKPSLCFWDGVWSFMVIPTTHFFVLMRFIAWDGREFLSYKREKSISNTKCSPGGNLSRTLQQSQLGTASHGKKF